MRRTSFVVSFLAAVCGAQVNYPDFADVSGLALVNHAVQSGVELVITPSLASQRGAVWTSAPEPVGQGFDTTFRFRIDQLTSGGADGFAFVIHNDPRQTTALGNHAAALGYSKFLTSGAGIAIANSIAIEFDTWLTTVNGVADISGNEISVHTNGIGENDHSELFTLGRVNAPINLSSGQVLLARVRYVPGTLDVFLSDMLTPVLTVPYDFNTGGVHILNGNAPVGGLSLLPGDQAFVGFTASSGAAAERHALLSWQLAPYRYQMNSAAATLTLNGLADPGPFSAIRVTHTTASAATLTLASINAGLPWDLAYTFGVGPVPVGVGGLLTPAGQSFNLNFTAGLGFLNGGALPDLFATSWPGAALTVPLTSVVPVRASAQLFVVDPTAPDGFFLSHAIDWEVTP